MLEYLTPGEEAIGRHNIGGYDIITTKKRVIFNRTFPHSFIEVNYAEINNIEHATNIAWGELANAVILLAISGFIGYNDWGFGLIDSVESVLTKYLPEVTGIVPTDLLLDAVMAACGLVGLYYAVRFVSSMRGYFRLSRRGGASIIIPSGMTTELKALIMEIGGERSRRIIEAAPQAAAAAPQPATAAQVEKQKEDVKSALKAKMKELVDSKVILVSAKSENHTPVVSSMLEVLVKERGMGGVYMSITRPYEYIQSTIKTAGVSSDNIFFIDCISLMAGKAQQKTNNVVFVENPSSLEEVSMYLDRMLEKVQGEKKFLFLDSLSSLLIYNNDKSVKEFTHFIINKIRLENITGIILSIEKKEAEDLVKTLTPMCDAEIRF